VAEDGRASGFDTEQKERAKRFQGEPHTKERRIMHFARVAGISMTLAFLGAPAYASASAPTANHHAMTAPHKKHDATAKKHGKKRAKKTPPKGQQR
jgi:hypothetical protein